MIHGRHKAGRPMTIEGGHLPATLRSVFRPSSFVCLPVPNRPFKLSRRWDCVAQFADDKTGGVIGELCSGGGRSRETSGGRPASRRRESGVAAGRGGGRPR